MSLMPTMRRLAPVVRPLMLEFSMVTPLVWRRLMPMDPSPPALILTWLMVTLSAETSMLPLTLRPVRVAPLPETSRQPPEEFQAHPGPLDTWSGTVCIGVPGGNPVLVLVGNAGVMPVPVVAAPAGPADITMVARAVPARALPAAAARTARAVLRPVRRPVRVVAWSSVRVALIVVSRRIMFRRLRPQC